MLVSCDDDEAENEHLGPLISIKDQDELDELPINQSINQSINRQSTLRIYFSCVIIVLASCFLLVYIVANLNPILHAITPLFQSINQSINHPKPLIDPLPSCSLLNVNLTHNLLHYQWTIQHRHANADCSYYPIIGQCLYESSGTGQSFDPSTDRTIPPSDQSFRPKWLVFNMRTGVGGWADRMKGFMTILTLAMLTGRAIAIDSEPTAPITITHTRSILDWRSFDSLPLSLHKSPSRLDLKWIGVVRPIFLEGSNFIKQWADHDVVTVTFNYNGFIDLMDNESMYDRYRTFGFHSWTDKGDSDLYWECLMDFTFRFSPAVLNPLNALLKSINRKPLKSWQEIEHDVPTLNQLITLQSNNEFILSNTTSAQRWNNYQSQFYQDQSINQSLPLTASQQFTNKSHQLVCLQLRMGSNAKFSAGSNQSSMSFEDSTGFILSEKFTHIFDQLDQLVINATHSSNNVSLFLTSDSSEFESYVPASWRDLQRLVAPGRTGHIDLVSSLGTSFVHEAMINTIVTHHLIGECDVAVVSRSGFGPTAMWRSRNRGINKPLQDAVYANKFTIKKEDGNFFPYVHMRGSSGREDGDYKEREGHIIKTGESLFGTNTMKMFISSPYGLIQASSQLPTEPPDDPMCTRFRFHQ